MNPDEVSDYWWEQRVMAATYTGPSRALDRPEAEAATRLRGPATLTDRPGPAHRDPGLWAALAGWAEDHRMSIIDAGWLALAQRRQPPLPDQPNDGRADYLGSDPGPPRGD